MTPTPRRTIALLVATPIVLFAFAPAAQASVSVSRAEAGSGRLRLEGTATANRAITVDGVQMATSGNTGSFKIDRSGYTSPADCTVDVNDGSAAPTVARLTGCTVVAPGPAPSPSPSSSPPASLFRITTGPVLPNARVGENYAGFIGACCGQGGPYTWSLVSGMVPAGLRFAGNSLRLVQTTGVTGVPTTVQTTSFTVRARDAAGNTSTAPFSITVDPPSPLVITNQSDQLADGQVGVSYATGLFPGGGTPPWTWSLVGGQLPPGLSVQASPGRILGTPSTAGTFTFTVRVADSGGQTASRQFAITVLP